MDTVDVDEARLAFLETSGLLEDDSAPFDRIAGLARKLLAVDTARLTLVDRDRQVFKGQSGLPPDAAAAGGTDLDRSFCKYAVATGEPLIVTDARETPLLRESAAILDDVVSYAGVPLAVGDGTMLGTLCVTNATPREWSTEDLQNLEELADVAKAALEYRLAQREADAVTALAGRLDEPVAKLGDSVRTAATLAEDPGDPRLPRVADLARQRLGTVESLTRDLTGAVRARQVDGDAPKPVDLTAVLGRVAALAGSSARPGDLTVTLPEEPVVVSWAPVSLGRALALMVTTALHHLPDTGSVEVTLELSEETARVRTTTPGRMPANEVLRVAGHFRSRDGAELPLDVRSRRGVMTAQSPVVCATSGPDGTVFDVDLVR